MDNLQLTNVVYQGLTSTSGDVVPISADYGFELEFTFDGIQTFDGTEIVQDNIQLWYIPAGGSSWQRNTEFSPSENSSVYTEQKSALVILNLDLSKSLEGQLPTLKSGAKSFLSRLYTASVDPDVIKRVYLNMTSMDLIIGQSETLQVTISPPRLLVIRYNGVQLYHLSLLLTRMVRLQLFLKEPPSFLFLQRMAGRWRPAQLRSVSNMLRP